LDRELIGLLSTPLFTGVLGYVTNWTGVWMLFYPLHFRGIRIPGLKTLSKWLPRKVQQVPGVMNGGIGWQGIIPSRAAKMGSIAADKGVAKLGEPSEFYEQLEPDRIAEHILLTARQDIRAAVERVMEREHPELWHDLPPNLRERVHARVAEQLPDVVRTVTDEIADNVEMLLDVKMMIIRRIEEDPTVANRIFLETGRKELRFIIRFGFVFGFLMGIPLAGAVALLHHWLLLLLGSAAIGYVTNWLGIWMIFEPVEPQKLGPFKFHGLFLRRQAHGAEVYGSLLAHELVSIENIGDELLRGARADRTRVMIEAAMRPAVDRAAGYAQPVVQVAMGPGAYDRVKESVASQAVEYTLTPLKEREFNLERREAMRRMLVKRIRELSPADFSELMRSAIRQDEWLLILHGGALGLVSGSLHLLLFPV
jgi:uncharacterized membrane protein YheB (UPF0754 family)